ncbi:MAG: M24 family metallopeptidase [Candidatus Pacebacteria bacterium]|nr:M24 family metallopeptidase [Candidatus Paceibacterota bacterium]
MALQKTKTEIAYVEKACKITDDIFSKIIADFSFKSEYELYLWIRREIKKRGLREAFPPIVTSGSRAGNEIHPKPTQSSLEGFVIVDFGVRVNGYCSDMTRTIFVGIPTNRDRELYKLLLSSKLKSEKLVRDGAQCATADAVARKALGSYKKYFIHTLGHGVGRRIHELPRIYFKRTEPIFKENMVVTVEPGIYIPNKLGIRIEDTYAVGKKNARALTKSPQKLLVFPKR